MALPSESWVKVAEGDNLDDLHTVVGDHQLNSGDQLRAYVKTYVPGAAIYFDTVGNWGWPAPPGTYVTDIYGEGGIFGSDGVVELTATSPWLAVTIGWIATNWAAILISGFVLAAILIGIQIFKKITSFIGGIPDWAVVAGVGIIGAILVVYLIGTLGRK